MARQKVYDGKGHGKEARNVSRKLKMSGKDACKQETKETWSIKQ
jgi:hypothetical protein